MIAVVDYGLGNLHSILKAVERVAAGREEVRLTESPDDVGRAARVVLPGVGAFGDTMKGLEQRGLIPALRRVFDDRRPFLGICMGMEALFAGSDENPGVAGLGVFPGTLRRFGANGLKVPHMGWNALAFPRPTPLFEGLAPGTHVYFVHSYHAGLSQPEIVAATSDHGVEFAAAVADPARPIFGAQFHPEKSQDAGLRILTNFVTLAA
ncbi:MAG: imidazole glycerol phosphate synthase subunit HisH [Candidatus Sumerlaeia bacterium]|nr:imidazole glycerol phosphate synthase subunit HisH [Candidatus Sumerlaeia bacterium]